MEKQSRRPDRGGGSVLLSDGALYGALGQGQIILVHIYRVLEGGCTGPQVEGRAGGSIAGEAAHRAAAGIAQLRVPRRAAWASSKSSSWT